MAGSKRRQRELARRHLARQRARRVQRAHRRRQRARVLSAGTAVAAVIAVVVYLLVGVVGGDDTDTLETAESSSESAALEPCPSVEPATVAEPEQFPEEPALTLEKKIYTAVLDTSCGQITLALDAAAAPHAVNSFGFLARQDFYDDTTCHRLTTTGIYVLQCGDPTGSGAGGPGYTFADENLEGATYPAGTVAMANSGPDTNGSQFFLVYQDTQLPPQYTPFGRVVSGLDVVGRVADAGVDGGGGGGGGGDGGDGGDGAPATPINIEDVTVAPGAPTASPTPFPGATPASPTSSATPATPTSSATPASPTSSAS